VTKDLLAQGAADAPSEEQPPRRESPRAAECRSGEKVSGEATAGVLLNPFILVTLIATGAVVLAGALAAFVKLSPAAAPIVGSIDLGPLAGQVFDNGAAVAAVAVFVATYFVVAIGKLPGYQLDRAGAALVGASLMVGLNVVSLNEAYRAIDFDAITLLLGMMIVVANLRLSGFFRLANNFVEARARSPLVLLGAIVAIAGSFSAFLVNDTICLVMTPLVLDLVTRLRRNPIPYLLAIPMASNIGSVATVTGNPQNMIIASFSNISYGAFASHLWPIAAVGVILTGALIACAYPREFLKGEGLPKLEARPVRYHGTLVVKSVVVTIAMMILFFLGQPVAKVAIVGGALLLLTRRVKAEKVYREIDWPLLLMFVGLFIVVTGLETAVLTPQTSAILDRLNIDNIPMLSLATAGLSNLVSNVPAVLLLKPFLAHSSDPQRAWLVIAMASTLAGNFTLVGSVANLIVAQRAQASGVTLGFWTYFKVGAPLTLLTIALGVWWL
jgi:Na+/H+ antiporter NhaD/arsenite permease-like protein